MDNSLSTSQTWDINSDLIELGSEADRKREILLHFLHENYTLMLIGRIFVCILTIINNAFLIFVILKFKKLQTKKNYIIINFAVLTAVHSIASTVSIVAENNSSLAAIVTATVATDLSLQLTFILATVLAFDWYFVKYFPDFVSGNQGIYKWVIVVSYIIPLLYFLPAFIAGYHWLEAIRLFTFIVFFVCFLIVVILVIIHFKGDYVDEDTKYSSGATLAFVYCLLWLIVIIAQVCFTFLPITDKMLAAYYRCHFIGLLASVITILVLIRRDKDIKASYADIFNCSDRNLPPENIVNGENEMLNMPKTQNV